MTKDRGRFQTEGGSVDKLPEHTHKCRGLIEARLEHLRTLLWPKDATKPPTQTVLTLTRAARVRPVVAEAEVAAVGPAGAEGLAGVARVAAAFKVVV